MEHVAIDLGGRESQICVRASDGVIIEERRARTAALGRYLGSRPHSRVILETCSESFHVADQARALGHEVRVVPATLVRSLGVGSRGVKNDRKDARVLSEVSCRIELPSVHIPSEKARELKSLCGMRDGLIRARTLLINTVRGWLRGRARRIRSGVTKTFALRVRRHFGDNAIELPKFVERQLISIEAITEQILLANQELETQAAGSELCQRLMTVPGVGPVTAVRFVAVVDDARRFATVHDLQSYLGLVPGERSSSDRKHRTSITKAGPAALRWSLVQAAWAARRCRRVDPMVHWSLRVESRRGKQIAVVALARKIAGVLFAVWRDGTVYESARMLRRAR
jgi:transposase